MKDSKVILGIAAGMLVLICLGVMAVLAIAQSGPTTPALTNKNPPAISMGKGDSEPSAEADAAPPPVIVVGFVGGFVGHDNMVHSPVQIAAHLRDSHPEGVYVKVFENRRREDAHREILNLLDIDHRGT